MILLLLACTNDNDKGTDLEAEAILAVKAITTREIDNLVASAVRIQELAPAPDSDGWTSAETGELEGTWKSARDSYEHVEGAIAVLFPDLDAATDERYDGWLAEGPDDNLFDGEGVRGIHAVERIVWADRHPEWVVTFESGLAYYTAAAFPSNQQEAEDFKNGLCAQLVTDTAAMQAELGPIALDSAAAFRGVIGSMAEQYEKVALASTGEDESRYAQYTLADMRANLAGGREIYEAFVPWLTSLEGGEAIDSEIQAGFDRVEAAYDGLSGDAIPAVPATWSSDAPSEADLQTDYGQLFSLLSTEADPSVEGSLVASMEKAADLLGIPQLP